VIRIIVVDDHAVVRQGVRRILEDARDVKVVGEAGSAEEALRLARQHPCDVLVTDVTLPGRNGLELVEDMKHAHPRVAVLVLSIHAEEQIALGALKAGAAGYLTKDAAPEELVRAIRKVHGGGKYVSPGVGEMLAGSLAGDGERTGHKRLSEREFQVLIRIARGTKPAQIADELGLSPKTVATYRSRLLRKMDFHGAADIVAYCIRSGLIA
jgi:DNA-binding NarL/FixJ family response regulator